MQTSRILLAVFLVLIMAAMIAMLYIKKDSIFLNTMEITYPDGCVERYVDDRMVTEECTVGREMQKMQENKVSNFSNFTIR